MSPMFVQRCGRVGLILSLVVMGMALSVGLVWAATSASDNAADSVYSNGWQTGDNGGAGWGGAWTLSTLNTAGHFVGSSTGNNSGVGTGDGDINTAGNTAWGLWANPGGRADATRAFGGAFGPGDQLTLQMDNGLVDSGARVGLVLQNAANENVLDIYFQGGGAFYVADGSAVNASSTGFSVQGLNITVTLLTSTTYQVTFQRLEDGAASTVVGTVKSPTGGQTITSLRLFNAGSGGGATKDLFFNNLTVTPAQCWATPNNGTTVYGSLDARAVRSALGAVAPNGTVKVAGYCAGVTNQSGSNQVALITQSITLAGGYTPTNWATYNPAGNATTLDAQGSGRVIYANVAATLQGFTATNGYSNTTVNENGGGIYAAGALTLTDMVVYSNTMSGTAGTQHGGGAYITGAALVNNATFSSNTTRNNGGGVYFGGGGSVYTTTFTNNRAASGQGGGVYWPSATTASVLGSAFTNNISSQAGGGGIFFGTAYVTNTLFSRNQGLFGGGASFDVNSVASITGSQFLTNTATLRGGGGNFSGAAAYVTNTLFIGNSAVTNGGAIAINNAGPKQFANTLFARNGANANGGAVYVNTGTVLLVHTTVVSPTLITNEALYVVGGTAYLTNTLIATATTGLNNIGGTVLAWNTLFANVSSQTSGSVTNNNPVVGEAGFIDPTNNDYHLTALSAALNAGTPPSPNITEDIDGDVRPWGGAPDIGYEEARAYISVQTNNWGLPGTWDVNSVPNDVRAVVIISPPHTVTVESNFSAQSLLVRGGLVVAQGNTLTVTQPVSNAGFIRMVRPVNNANVAFAIPSGGAFPAYRLVDVNTANNLGVVTATVWGLLGGEYCTVTGASSPVYARRCFDVTPTTQAAATLRLWVLNSELNGLSQANLFVYRNFPNSADAWVQLNSARATGNDGNTYTWVQDTTPGFSFFLVGDPTAPTAIELAAFTAQAPRVAPLIWALIAALGLLGSYGLWRWRLETRD